MAGACHATPTRSLEIETRVQLPDIYLNKRMGDVKTRLERTGKTELICDAYTAIRRCLFTRRPPQDPTWGNPNWEGNVG